MVWVSGTSIYLVEVLGLYAVSCLAHLARLVTLVQHEQLVDDDVVRVDAALGEFLHEPLRLVQRQELRDAHAHERRLVLRERTGKLQACLHCIFILGEGKWCEDQVHKSTRISSSPAKTHRDNFDGQSQLCQGDWPKNGDATSECQNLATRNSFLCSCSVHGECDKNPLTKYRSPTRPVT